MTVTEQIQSLKRLSAEGLNEVKIIELELPDRCECGLLNMKIWGTRTNGRLVIGVRCMRCGTLLSRVEQNEDVMT